MTMKIKLGDLKKLIKETAGEKPKRMHVRKSMQDYATPESDAYLSEFLSTEEGQTAAANAKAAENAIRLSVRLNKWLESQGVTVTSRLDKALMSSILLWWNPTLKPSDQIKETVGGLEPTWPADLLPYKDEAYDWVGVNYPDLDGDAFEQKALEAAREIADNSEHGWSD